MTTTSPTADWNGRVLLVTGAASGIGAAIADAALAAGARLLYADRNIDAAREAAVMTDSLAFEVDVSDEDSVRRMFQEVRDEVGGVDSLVNVAGVQRAGSIVELSIEDWDLQFAVNVRGTFLMTKHAVPIMAGRPGATIVNVASAGGLIGLPDVSGYAASKAAVISFTKTAAKELIGQGIRVNAISPGWVATPFNDPFVEIHGQATVDALVEAQIPLQRQSSPAEIAQHVLFLAGPNSSYMVGHNMVADGGLTV